MLVWVPSLDCKGEVQLELNDDFVFKHICNDVSRGVLEESILATGAITECRFQVLFDFATHYFANGDYRSCLINAQCALERYREFFIRLVLAKHCLKDEDIASYFKSMSKQTERQIGAFNTVFLLNRKQISSDISNKMTSYRNDVIHKGTFPNKDQTFVFCKRVIDIIAEGIKGFDSAELISAQKKDFNSRSLENIEIELSINPVLNFKNFSDNAWLREFENRIKQKHPHLEITFPYQSNSFP